MRNLFVEIFIREVLLLEKIGLELIKVPKISPNNETLNAFKLLKKIYIRAEKNGIKLWLTGSRAITARNGSYFKNIDDIDFTLKTREDEKKMSELLVKFGLVEDNSNPMGANRFIDPNTNVHIDYGSVTYPGTIYYKMNLKEDEIVNLDGFNPRVIPLDRQIKLYKHLLFRRGRSIKKDIQKLKILYNYNN